MTHISTQIVHLPPKGENPQVDAQVLAGRFRDLTTVVLKNGKTIRVGRTKGITYRKPK